MADVQLGSVPFIEAIEHFRAKLTLPTPYADSIDGEVHAKAFTVAGATKLDLLNDLLSLIDSALVDGTSFAYFKKGFDTAVAKHGWNFNGEPNWRASVIYDTNLRTAAAAGRWKQIQRTKDTRPYLIYDTAGDALVRPEHAKWDETVLLIDDPWWDTHYPPNDWGCRCSVRTLSQRQLEREGLVVSGAPELETAELINIKTGEVYGEVPKGIGVGWDYNVGKEWLRWDKAGRLPDCGEAFDFSEGDRKTCIALLPGQKTWKDYSRPDLRNVPLHLRTESPGILPSSESEMEAINVIKSAINMTTAVYSIRTVINETVVFEDRYIPHLVGKRENARERYANFILPTLLDPFEVYLTEYGNGVRSRYIGLFTGKNNLLVVIRRNKDGSLLWNMMNASDKRMNKQRVGELVFKKE